MSTAIEDAVEIDRVQLPPCRDGRDVFIQSCNECYMSRSRLCGNACMGDAKGAMFKDSRAEEWRQRAGNFVVFRLWIGFGEGLKGFVCS